MEVDFMPQDLAGYTAGTYAARNTGKTNEEILEELGISITQPGDNTSLDFEDYLQLMVQQLQNQTMDNAMDSSAMLEQLVQMSSVQMMASLQTSMQTVADGMALSYAASLVGKTVTVGTVNEDGNIQEIVGEISGTGTYQGVQVIFIDGEMYPLSNIMAVGVIPEDIQDPEKPETPEDGGENPGENIPEESA